MNKKIIAVLVIMGLMMGFITGCQDNNVSQNGTDNKKVTINFPTAGTTGTIYTLGSAMANLWNNKVDLVQVTAQASNGGVHNLNLLKEGEAQISFANTSIVYESFHGLGTFEGRKNENVRIIAGLYYNPSQIVVREATGIESLADLKGKRFVPGAPGSTPEVETKIHLMEYGLKYPEDIQPTFVGFTEAIDLMRNNQVDGAMIIAGIPTAAVTEMISTARGKLIGVDEDIIASLQEKYPWYASFTIPAGTYENQTEDITTTAVKLALITDASLDEELIYQLTKTFWENIEILKQSHPIVNQIELEKATVDLSGVPLHAGAERYYKEIGLIE
ncbi:MAG: TAXI family TRAP transporter solute-binding subunit [Clostridia bacterium]|nr:TAXI family TRAP transporter solute-binding subunit [Clostridia bacterium]